MVCKDQDKVQGPARHRELSTPGDRAARDEGTPDEAARSDQSIALAVVRSPAANRNRVRRNAKSVGSLRVAQHQPSGELALERHMDKAQPVGAELSRWGMAVVARLVPERE